MDGVATPPPAPPPPSILPGQRNQFLLETLPLALPCVQPPVAAGSSGPAVSPVIRGPLQTEQS